MDEMNSDYRDFALRRHRILGHFLSSYAWRKGADCVNVSRQQLQAYLDLEKFREERLQWLVADLKSYFPYSRLFYREGSFNEAFFSRRPFNELPLPQRSETSFLRERPQRAILKELPVDPAVYRAMFGADASPPTYSEELKAYLEYLDEPKAERIRKSSHTLELAKSWQTCKEAEVLAILALGFAGLDDSRGYD